MKGKRRSVGAFLLFLLWTSWCQTCLAQLRRRLRQPKKQEEQNETPAMTQEQTGTRRNRQRNKPRATETSRNNATNATTNKEPTSVCQALKSKISHSHARRRRRFFLGKRIPQNDMNWAYRMAVVSSLCYWNHLQRDAWPHTVVAPGFALAVKHKHNKAIQLVAPFHFLRKWLALQLCRLVHLGHHLGSLLWGPSTWFHTKTNCQQSVPHGITLHYYLYDWHERSALGNYHDTDLLVATSHGGRTLILAFAGTETPADTITNVQTFEPVRHAGFFGTTGTYNNSTTTTTPIMIQGSVHRGFLNALTRVERGWILRFGEETHSGPMTPATSFLYQHYTNCTRDFESEPSSRRLRRRENDKEGINNSNEDSMNQEEQAPRDATKDRKRKRLGCHGRDVKLIDILRRLVIDNLQAGRSVYLTGHSLGGGLATLLAMDILINFPHVPVKKLRLWTFGAPQVADELFFDSAVELVPRMAEFFSKHHSHRFVTLSDQCHEDIVSNVAQRALAPQQRNLWGKAFRRLGGVRGSVVHFNEPHYLLTPQQYLEEILDNPVPKGTNSATKSAVSAHQVKNYLSGISRESDDHPLTTNLPDEVRRYIGEAL